MLEKRQFAATVSVVYLVAAFVFVPVCVCAQERPLSVSPCELVKNPGMYDESLVSVLGLLLYGQQVFNTHAYDCADDRGGLRLEFGGNPSEYADRFKLSRERLEASAVPLKKDADYDTMQRLMKSATASGQTKMLRATLIGRFYAGPALGNKSGEVKYPNTRLVISEVDLVSNRIEDPVDFTGDSHAVAKPAKGCSVSELPVPSREDADKLQRLSREPSENLDYLRDPKQVAARTISEQEKIAADNNAIQLRLAGEAVSLNTYTWTSANGLTTYAVTVDRPYWLLPSTNSGDTVIWVPKRIAKTTCVAKPAH
jgi:hypothetical protein